MTDVAVWLLTAWVCGGPGSSCPKHFEVYDNSAACQVALAKWTNSGGWWFASGVKGGMCLPQNLTPDEIAIYRNFKP